VRHNRRRHYEPNDLHGIQLRRKYFLPIALSEEKKADLRKMLPFLMPVHRAHYARLIDQENGDGAEEEMLF